ncbi:MAG: hypothetical protein ABF323_03235 [Lentimonas sp.]
MFGIVVTGECLCNCAEVICGEPVEAAWEYLPAPQTKVEKEGGLIMVGSKQTFYHYDMRPNSVKLNLPNGEWREFRRTLPVKTIPPIKGSIQGDWASGITDGTAPCSNFAVSTKLTELILLGVVALRAGHGITWDATNMQVLGHPELDTIIKQFVRDGWSYGEGLWT